jgi:hypothetical protein
MPGIGSALHVPTGVVQLRSSFFDILVRERTFLLILSLGFLLAGVSSPFPAVAAWVGFLFAGYSAVANDSIQTIGTFIASNRKKPWWLMWLFIGGIFLVTVTYSWVVYSGDVSYQRLAAKGFDQSPTQFSFLQVAAPLFLLVLTRLRMPVSTTFLLLTSFATSAESVGQVLSKSVSGYVVAFGGALVLWFVVAWLFERVVGRRSNTSTEPHRAWRVAQWMISGGLWSVWLMQDASNVAVYLPRQLGPLEFAVFALAIFGGLGILFKMGGEKVQEVVEEKSHVVDVRAATMIDLSYVFILLYFKTISNVPMSTTWVFIGLLGGRELAMALRRSSDRSLAQATRLLLKDLAYVSIGLLVSIALAVAVNEGFRREIAAWLGLPQ